MSHREHVAIARVSWFDLRRKFGFVELDGSARDAFLHISVLKKAGYVSLPAGTTLRVRIEAGPTQRRVREVLSVDTSTALPGEPAAVLRKSG